MTIAHNAEPIQWVSAGFILIALVFIALQVVQKRDRNVMLWLLPIAIWMIHGLLFYVTLFINRSVELIPGVSYTVWSSVLRLHGYITIASIEIAQWYLNRLENHYGKR